MLIHSPPLFHPPIQPPTTTGGYGTADRYPTIRDEMEKQSMTNVESFLLNLFLLPVFYTLDGSFINN